MRTIVLTVALAVAGLFGLSFTPAAHADGVRVFVDLGDVYFTAGRPYYRHNRQPLYVVHHAYGPRYYYSRPAYPVSHRYGYRDGHGYRDHDRRGVAYRHDGYRDHGYRDYGYRDRGRYHDGRGDHGGDHRGRGDSGHGHGDHRGRGRDH